MTVRVVDSTDGTPETAVAYNTTGAAFWYKRGATGAKTAISLATQTDTGAHTDGGFVHTGDGMCRLDLPDAAVAAGVDYVTIGGTFTDMVVIGTMLQLIAYNPRTENAPADVLAISTDATAADNLEAACDGTTYNIGGGAVVAASVTGAVGSVTGNVTGSIGSLATQAKADVNAEADTAISDAALATAAAVATVDSNVDAILADTGTDGVVLSAATYAAIADVVLRRTAANIEASANGDTLDPESLYGLLQAAFNATRASTVLTIRKTDNTTLGTRTITTDAAADPVTAITD
ncbi:MAG: hypothetical protein KDC48_17425 [Planctomycetes bacterium]|nr:hypothetical protein [Planctomycetota bacterium]